MFLESWVSYVLDVSLLSFNVDKGELTHCICRPVVFRKNTTQDKTKTTSTLFNSESMIPQELSYTKRTSTPTSPSAMAIPSPFNPSQIGWIQELQLLEIGRSSFCPLSCHDHASRDSQYNGNGSTSINHDEGDTYIGGSYRDNYHEESKSWKDVKSMRVCGVVCVV